MNPKLLLDRAARYRKALTAEHKKFGAIDDSGGKRYRIGPLYILAGEPGKAVTYYRWFAKQFPDDVGEPLHLIYWVLALLRVGKASDAAKKLLEVMVRNLYVLPALAGLPRPEYDIWHSSNWETPEYMKEVPKDLCPPLTNEERSWIGALYGSFLFQRVRDEYISAFGALKHEHDVKARREILRKWYSFWGAQLARYPFAE